MRQGVERLSGELYEHMLGYTSAEVLGKQFRDAVYVHEYEVCIVNRLIRMMNKRYDMDIPEVKA